MDNVAGHIEERRRLGVRIASLRMERKLSQRALAASLGLDRPTLNAIESGTGNPTFETLCRIAEGLGVDVGELFNGF